MTGAAVLLSVCPWVSGSSSAPHVSHPKMIWLARACVLFAMSEAPESKRKHGRPLKIKPQPSTLSFLPQYYQLMTVFCLSSKSREVPFTHEWGMIMVGLQDWAEELGPIIKTTTFSYFSNFQLPLLQAFIYIKKCLLNWKNKFMISQSLVWRFK